MEHEETGRKKKTVYELRQEYPGTRFLFSEYWPRILARSTEVNRIFKA